MRILLLCALSVLAVDQAAGQDIIGFSNYKVIQERPVELTAALFGVSILPGQSVSDLGKRLPLTGYDDKSAHQILLEGSRARVVLKYSEKGVYETSIESSYLGYTKEFAAFDENDLSVTVFGEGLFHVPLSLVLQKWGLPDVYEKIGEVMYSLKETNEMVILGYNIYGRIDRISMINGSFVGKDAPF